MAKNEKSEPEDFDDVDIVVESIDDEVVESVEEVGPDSADVVEEVREEPVQEVVEEIVEEVVEVATGAAPAVTVGDLNAALPSLGIAGTPFAAALLKHIQANQDDVNPAGVMNNPPVISIGNLKIQPKIIAVIDREIAVKNRAVPFLVGEKVAFVATDRLPDVNAFRVLAAALGMKILIFKTKSDDVDTVLERFFGPVDPTRNSLITQLVPSRDLSSDDFVKVWQTVQTTAAPLTLGCYGQ